MFTLLKGGNVYTPDHLGCADVLIFNKTIVKIDQNIDNNHLPMPCQTIDLKEKIITPGFIDQHVHLTGGGGEGGFDTRTPEVQLSALISAGTTTVVGVLGTDCTTRSVKSLYAKAKALENEGITTFMHTGSYEIPTQTITDSVRNDMIFIDKVLGVKIAMADHRSSFPTANEVIRILSDIRVGGMIAQKKGLLHIHMGSFQQPFSIINTLLDRGFPIKHFSPTHVSRKRHLLEEAIAFAKCGGIIDITSGGGEYSEPSEALIHAIKSGVSPQQITFSSDGNGSLPEFNSNGEMTKISAAPVNSNLELLPHLLEKCISLEQALCFFTVNVANALGIAKGRIHSGEDADINIFDKEMRLDRVYAGGKLMFENGRPVQFGRFEREM